jgi:hypothetical protein
MIAFHYDSNNTAAAAAAAAAAAFIRCHSTVN